MKGWDLLYNSMPAYEAHGGYLLVTPHSGIDERGRHRWHWMDGDARSDFDFTDALVAWLVQSRRVDAGLIFGTGHSSGGIFLYSWAQGGPFNSPVRSTDPTTFRAVSPSGANQMVGTVEMAGVSTEVPLLIVHGADDDVQHWSTDPNDASAASTADVSSYFGYPADHWDASAADTTFNNDRRGQYWFPAFDARTTAESSARLWAAAAGCDVDASPVLAEGSGSCMERYEYEGCDAPVEVRGYLGYGHKVCAASTRLEFFDRFCSGAGSLGCDWGERCDRSSGTCVAISGWQHNCDPSSGCAAPAAEVSALAMAIQAPRDAPSATVVVSRAEEEAPTPAVLVVEAPASPEVPPAPEPRDPPKHASPTAGHGRDGERREQTGQQPAGSSGVVPHEQLPFVVAGLAAAVVALIVAVTLCLGRKRCKRVAKPDVAHRDAPIDIRVEVEPKQSFSSDL